MKRVSGAERHNSSPETGAIDKATGPVKYKPASKPPIVVPRP